MSLSALLSACTVQMFLICQINSAPGTSFYNDFELHNTPEISTLTSNKGASTGVESQTNLPKKWIMGRANRINNAVPYMLFKKNYVFRNEAPPAEFYSSFDSSFALNVLFTQFLTKLPQIEITTESDIEFYYLNENGNDIKQKTKIKDTPKIKHRGCQCKLTSKIDTVTHRPLQTNKPVYRRSNLYIATDNDKASEKAPKSFVRELIPPKTNSQSGSIHILQRVERDDSSGIKEYTSLSTQNDRIKFFEQYDSLTEVLNNSTEEYTNHNNEYLVKKDKIVIEDNDYYGFTTDSTTTQYPHVKKHSIVQRDITKNYPTNYDIKTKEVISSTVKDNYTKEIKSYETEKIAANTLRDDLENEAYQNSMVWAKYPFTAVYVYEQFRVHCDAAAINPYWLLASATCLSRHREDPLGEDRSAFVAYCGDNWWTPERINYVKSTHIHPNFNPKDTVRRHVYNIGVIQVVTSMATSCQNWAPVTIMSYQYVAESDNSIGSAVGWGLDRYDTSFTSMDLPKRPMAVYKSLIYSNKCPGNAGYSLSKLLGDEATKNIYCLALPMYDGEVNDPTHGGLLLVGGKLVALYLQEERRRFGEQSAQYTGIWKLLPWVLKIAKEPEEMDLFLD